MDTLLTQHTQLLKMLMQFWRHNNITFIGFGRQEGWITTDIKTYTTNSKTVSTHQLSDESQNSQSATEFNAASLVQSISYAEAQLT